MLTWPGLALRPEGRNGVDQNPDKFSENSLNSRQAQRARGLPGVERGIRTLNKALPFSSKSMTLATTGSMVSIFRANFTELD